MADDAKTIRGRPPSSSEDDVPPLPTERDLVAPAAAGDSSVMPTHVGDSRHDSRGNVLAPPSIPPSRYVLGAEIARGGMGRVVEATDTLLGRVVALKEALSTDPESLERFARETRITARLEHPSIVPVHDGGKGPNGMPYYVMRKIEGRPLERLVAQSEKLSDRLYLVRHMVAAAEAIAHAHERGIVHRDIKPSNILVGELGETIVIDWGLAKVIGEEDEPTQILGVPLQGVTEGDTMGVERVLTTRAGIVFGTPGFMAPEQLRGGPVDPRWDVYALGATLYHLLSKKPPHHAKSVDEMMRAAVLAPPMPISELVNGVPPVLGTIVDKALAFDPEQRYQDARLLAEDLQRFLGGQLVASHHYTPREKISRYVLQHRYAFIVGAVAAAALMVGGAIAFVRIVNERNRADHNAIEARRAQKVAEDEKRLAESRSEDLSLSSARSVASTNPTFAIALAKPLVDKRWREVRAIAAEARAAGVAWSLPASTTMQSLHFSRDGRRMLGAGEEGTVRLYDLDARTHKTLLDAGAPVTARFVDDEKKVLLWIGARISILDLDDPRGSGRRDIEIDVPIVSLEVVGTSVYWVDVKAALWQMDLGAVAPRQIPLDEGVSMLAASPDQRWIALAGVDHLMLYDRNEPAKPPMQVLNGTLHALDWAKDGARLAILHDNQAVEIAMEPSPYVVHRLTVGERSHVVASNKRVFTIGPTGVGMLSVAQSRPRKQLSRPIGLEESKDDAIIAGGEEQLVVLTEHGDHNLGAPSGRFSMVRASPASPYVVALAEDRLLVWNLDELVPRVASTQIATAKFVTGDDLVATTLDGPAQWIDLVTGNRRDLGAWPAILDVVVSPSGRHAVVVDMAHVAHLIEAGKPPVTIEGTVERAGFVTDTQVVLATDDGTIDIYDVPAQKRERLHRHGAKLVSIAWGGTAPAFVAVHFVDGMLWRKNLTSGEVTANTVPRTPTSNLRVTAGGDAYFAIGNELRRWPVRARDFAHHATLPFEITSLGAIGSEYLLAFSDGGAAYLVSLAKPDAFTDLEESLGRASASMSSITGLVAVQSRGSIDVLDPLIKPARFRLASGTTYADVQISNDGRRILAKAGSTLVVWDLTLPNNAPETSAWLDKMTNAITGSGAKSLDWR
ncbi:MAG: WD40 repeat domain-containing serine/threonine protein kinase [Kofleriaceae bacterium]